jgi:hypothetical protein
VFVLAVLGLTVSSGVRRAEAIDWDSRWWVGARVADYLPADEVNGGFRINQELFGTRSERDVKPRQTVFGGFTLGYGLKRWDGETKWRRFQLSLELEVSRLETTVGNETGFRDLDGSTRLNREFPEIQFPRGEQDVSFVGFPVGDLELTPVFVNALFHWGTDRADFYAGAGLGLVLADIAERDEYREFTADFDGVDDVIVDDAVGANFKLGSNLRLTPNGNAFLFFELQYFTTALTGGNKVEWAGTVRGEENGIFLGQAEYDTDDNGVPDRVLDADLRIVDPGKVRVDGAVLSLGLRYRFGGGKKSAQADAEETAGF